MIFLYVEPNVTDADKPVTITIQGNGSGLNFSGLQGELDRFGTLDVDLSNPAVLRSIVLDSAGFKSFQVRAGDLGSAHFQLGAKFNSDVGLASMEVTNFGGLALMLDDLLCAFRHIPRYEEPGRISEDGTAVRFGWGNWHSDVAPVLTKNTNTWLQSGYQVDYKKGVVYLNTTLQSGEEIRGSYSFRMIDLATYRSFFSTALGIINAKKPQTQFDENNYPAAFNGLLLLYGYMMACRAIIPKLSTFAYRRLFENPDQLVTSLQTNAQMTSSEFLAFLPDIKRRGLIAPAAVSSFQIGRQNPWQVDEINFAAFVVSRV